jgi:hemolysin-activating ACP:hemolysin acyltransferase
MRQAVKQATENGDITARTLWSMFTMIRDGSEEDWTSGRQLWMCDVLNKVGKGANIDKIP